MTSFYEFILYVELNDDVEKKTIELSNYNNLYRIKQWSNLSTTDENVKIREIVFESQYNIYNFILQSYNNHKITKLIGFIKTPLFTI